MSVLLWFEVRCDAKECLTDTAMVMASTVEEAREGAEVAGWCFTGGRDYCPAHPHWSYREVLNGAAGVKLPVVIGGEVEYEDGPIDLSDDAPIPKKTKGEK